MEKLNKRISIIFGVIVAIFICLALGNSHIETLNHQDHVIFRSGDDFMADYFNVQRYISERDPYYNEINTRSEHGYLPLSYLLILPLNNVCDYAHMSLEDCWHTPMALYTALLFLLISLFFFFDSLYRLNNKKGWKIYNTFLLLFTSLFLFSIERGNEIFISAAGINYFLAYYDTESKWKRIFALFCLCFAAVLKVYPVLFGILLLQDKRYKDIAFCVVTGLILTFVPFFFFKHGLSSIPHIFENIHIHTETYSTPSTEYQFGIHALCKEITYAIYYLHPDSISDHSANLVNTFAQVTSALLALISLVLAFFERRRWLQLGLIAMVIMVYPFHSIFYCALYLLPMMILFLSKEECTKIDYVIAGLLVVIMNPIQFVVEPISLTPVIANICTIILWILFIVYSGKGLYEKRKNALKVKAVNNK